jgi:hypothetical protein
MIDATVILHNILIEWGEEEDTVWIDFDDFSDLDDAMRAPYQEGDELNEAIPTWMAKDTRRQRILNYFKEYDSMFLKAQFLSLSSCKAATTSFISGKSRIICC